MRNWHELNLTEQVRQLQEDYRGLLILMLCCLAINGAVVLSLIAHIIINRH